MFNGWRAPTSAFEFHDVLHTLIPRRSALF
jgi:hypothetical protein